MTIGWLLSRRVSPARYVVFLLGLMLSLPSFAQQNLVYCPASAPEGFDPARYTSGTTFDASSRLIYDGLVGFAEESTEVVPALAKSFTVSEDGLHYTFNLRSGIKFHTTDYFTPTRPLNADDVVFSLQRQLQVDHPFHSISGGAWEYFNGMSMPDLVQSIEALDELTVKITLSQPDSAVLANLAMDFASILSAEYAEKLLLEGKPELLDRLPVGTGPFVFVDFVGETLVRYKAHENYWAGRANLDSIEFRVIPDQDERIAQFTAGTCHILSNLDDEAINRFGSDVEYTIIRQIGLNIGYLAYNTSIAPFDNVNVRKALNMAINKEALVEFVYGNAGVVAKNPFPPTMWSYNHDVFDDPYNPSMARSILLAEGVQDMSIELWAMPVVLPFNPNAFRMAEALKTDFENIGVSVNIVTLEWGEYLKRSKAKDRVGAVLFGWSGDNGDPDNFLSVLLSCDAVGNANRAQWCYKPFDNLIQQAKRENSLASRSELYKSAQVVFKEQAPWATIAHSVVNKAVLKGVENVQIDAFGGLRLYNVSISNDRAQ